MALRGTTPSIGLGVSTSTTTMFVDDDIDFIMVFVSCGKREQAPPANLRGSWFHSDPGGPQGSPTTVGVRSGLDYTA